MAIDSWGGLPLKSPKDVVVRSDGTMRFTDPGYGHGTGCGPNRRPVTTSTDETFAPGCSPSSTATSSKSNGLAFSPDESVLCVTGSGSDQGAGGFYLHLPHHVIAHDVHYGRHLVNRRLFAVTNPAFPDGLKLGPRRARNTCNKGGIMRLSGPPELQPGRARLTRQTVIGVGGVDGSLCRPAATDIVCGRVAAGSGFAEGPASSGPQRGARGRAEMLRLHEVGLVLTLAWTATRSEYPGRGACPAVGGGCP